jgi:mannose-6-phosphate isomerase-like protein (cupin superfamily)
MQRRSFLLAISSSVVPAAGLQEILARQVEAQSTASTPSSRLHVVGAGNDRFGQPHTLGFSIEHARLQAGGPPLHQHFNQAEWFYVMEGEVAFLVGELRVNLRSGESVLAPRRIPHTFRPSVQLLLAC